MKIFDEQLLNTIIKENKTFEDMKETMAKEVIQFNDNFYDDPKWVSAWGHNYFCSDDGSALIYNPDNSDEHECPLCHKVYKDPLYKQVWIYKYRNEALLNCYKAAVLYKLSGEEKYLQVFKNISEFYMERYEQFPLHTKEGKTFESLETMGWGCGRLMPQGLNECIGLIRLFAGMTIIKKDLDQVYLNKTSVFVKQVYALLKPQVEKIHNISCWVNSAIGCLGLFDGNEEMIDFAFNGELNIRRQLREGVTDDGFWHEGSIHYNFFTMEGISYLALMAKAYDYDFGREADIFEYMFEAAYKYSFDNHRLPNPNDGWPDVNLKTYTYIYSIGAKVFGYESAPGRILANILAGHEPRQPVPLSKPYYYKNEISLEQFVYIPDFSGQSTYDKQKVSTDFHTSNFTLLKKGDSNLFFKYGHNSPSHAHPDKMTLEYMVAGQVVTRDLSNTGYCSKMCNEWHRMSVAHNTVVVDGSNQTNVKPGAVNVFEEDLIDAMALNVYEGVDFRRRLQLLDNGFSDEFYVSSKEHHVYDYVFHVDGELISEGLEGYIEAGQLEYKNKGYQHLKNIKQVKGYNNKTILKWKLKHKVLEMSLITKGKADNAGFVENPSAKWLDTDENMEIFLCESPDNPVDRHRSTVIIRKKTDNTAFKVNWTLKP